jgi:hypothetical protein
MRNTGRTADRRSPGATAKCRGWRMWCPIGDDNVVPLISIPVSFGTGPCRPDLGPTEPSAARLYWEFGPRANHASECDGTDRRPPTPLRSAWPGLCAELRTGIARRRNAAPASAG